MASYSEYYQRAIDGNDLGIKLVLGPTGLGKSSSIPEVVRNNPDRKFIYQANRKELLQEMAARFSPGEFVILRRDLEVVQEMLATQQNDFDLLLADPRFANLLKQAKNKTHLKSLESIAIRRASKLSKSRQKRVYCPNGSKNMRILKRESFSKPSVWLFK